MRSDDFHPTVLLLLTEPLYRTGTVAALTATSSGVLLHCSVPSNNNQDSTVVQRDF